jgi:Rieske Fe-S protein
LAADDAQKAKGPDVEGPGPTSEEAISRRRLFQRVAAIGGGAMAVFYLGVAVDLLLPPPAKAAVFQDLGPLSAYPLESPTLKPWTGGGYQDAVFVIRHAQGTPTVFDFHCPHLECAVRWLGAANEFACPCHGSTYNIKGQHTGGPAPHGLWYHAVQVRGTNLWVGGQTGANAGNASV